MPTDVTAETSLSGFIVTRQWIESDTGLELTFWLASEQGPLRFRLAGQEAVCFFPSQQQQQVSALLANKPHWRINTTQLKNFSHEQMSALYFKSQRMLFDYRDKLIANEVAVVEADIYHYFSKAPGERRS